MRPSNAASDYIRCGRSRYAAAPTQAAAIIAALRARWHFTSEFCAGCPDASKAKIIAPMRSTVKHLSWRKARRRRMFPSLSDEQTEPRIRAGTIAVIARKAHPRRPFHRTGPPRGGMQAESVFTIGAIAQGLRFRTDIA